MTIQHTPRYAIPYPQAADANDVPAHLLAMATLLDNKMSTFGTGAIGSRPAAGTSGRFWRDTVTGDVTYDDGSAWHSLTGNPVLPIARYETPTNVVCGATPVVVHWNSTAFNHNGFPTITTSTAKIVVPVMGYYKVKAQIKQQNNGGGAPGSNIIEIRKDPNSDTAGTQVAISQQTFDFDATFDDDNVCSVQASFQLNSGQGFAIWMSSHPTTVGLYAATYATFVEVRQIGT